MRKTNLDNNLKLIYIGNSIVYLILNSGNDLNI
jgi:hypothetical protein